jgi:hypothetical protein
MRYIKSEIRGQENTQRDLQAEWFSQYQFLKGAVELDG